MTERARSKSSARRRGAQEVVRNPWSSAELESPRLVSRPVISEFHGVPGSTGHSRVSIFHGASTPWNRSWKRQL